MRRLKFAIPFFFILCILGIVGWKGSGEQISLIRGGATNSIKKCNLIHSFAYNKNDSIIVSGHRGGLELGFPENSLEGLNNVISKMPAFFEIDPRLTKDSIIVLMHDATLDRTSTGKGKVSDYTYSELQAFRLKDLYGNITNCRIPRLEDVIKWSKGKTIVNLDKKDVPMQMIVRMIKRLNAQDCVMLTVHTGAQARYYFDRLPKIKLSVFARTAKEFEDIAISGVPWKNMIAYVGNEINGKNEIIVEKLHARGVKCMVSFAPTLDKSGSQKERIDEYKKTLEQKPDIIESDYPNDVWMALKSK